MKVKKIIKTNWKLESPDNLDNIKQQLSFDEQTPNFIQQYKYKMIFSVVSCILIMCLFIVSGMFVGGGFDGNLSDDPSNPMSPAPDAPQDPSSPGENEDAVNPEEPSVPGDPEGPGYDDSPVYNLFIEELKNNVIVSDYVNFITYDNENIEDDVKIKILCEFFNNLRKCALQNDSTEFYIKNAKIEMLIKNARKIKINYKQYYDLYIKDEDNTFEETINDIEKFFEEIGLLDHISDKFGELTLDL